MSTSLQQRLRRAVTEGRAAPLELALADWALRHGAEAPVALAFAACAQAVADGHSCLALDRGHVNIGGEAAYCAPDELAQALANSPLVGAPGAARPLILAGQRLYLQRYWAYEQQLAAGLRRRLVADPDPVDISALLPGGGLFDTGDRHETDWQAVAAFVALRHRFALISGGPGTGKTYIVLRLMRLLIETARQTADHPPLIRLAAPTGKAAARMVEAIRTGLADMAMPADITPYLPVEAATLHRLLGIVRGTTRPRHDPDNPLAADVVIVDEASMIDLPMMAKLVAAIPEQARLILLGDRYQLASVESGSVVAELCEAAGVNLFSAAQLQAAGPLLRQPRPAGAGALADHVVTLQTSHRFRADSALGRLAAAVNAGDAEAALAIVTSDHRDILRYGDSGAGQLAGLAEATADRYQDLMAANDPEQALQRLQQHCLLCALRLGPAGSISFNLRITEHLAKRHGFESSRRWYHGRPVIVTRNDYRAGLFNGDTGVCLGDGRGGLRVWFTDAAGPRSFLPTALPEHDTAYALTVHKSQGSEFEAVTLVLPAADHPVLSRELLYTGITRARSALVLCADTAVLAAAIRRPIARHSGLADGVRRET